MLSEVCKLCIIFLFPILVASASKWDLKMSLRDLISGHCHVVTPRVCRKYTGFGSDFTCGFILRHVCTNKYTGKQSLKMLSETDGNVHITPLPRGISFYDVNEDGLISLYEFARTLGHKPRDLHVKVAFRAADKNGDGVVSLSEFKTTDAWVFETNHIERNHYPKDNNRTGVKIGHPKFLSRVHPNPAILGVYADSDEDDISEEQMDSLENSQSTELIDNYDDDHYEDSNEIHDEVDDSREENVQSQKGHIVPPKPPVDISEEMDDSREVEENSHEVETASHEESNSNEMEHTSDETFDASEQFEDDSYESEDSKSGEYEEYDDSIEQEHGHGSVHEEDLSISQEHSGIYTDSMEVEDSREV